jgi:hypothetical protein
MVTRVIQLLLQVTLIALIPVCIAAIALIIALKIVLCFMFFIPAKCTLPGNDGEEEELTTTDVIAVAIVAVVVGLPVGIALMPLCVVAFSW